MIEVPNVDRANQLAVGRMIAARPVLKRVARAGDVIPGMRPNLLLHAGPPIEWDRMSGPLRGAVVGALIFEGLADDEASAISLVEAGSIDFEPCHHHATVGPMAGVTSASMLVYVVEDESPDNKDLGLKAYSNLNEGYGKVLRYGAFSAEVIGGQR